MISQIKMNITSFLKLRSFQRQVKVIAKVTGGDQVAKEALLNDGKVE